VERLLPKSGCVCVILDFRREVDEDFLLLVYYVESSGNLLPMFQNNLLNP